MDYHAQLTRFLNRRVSIDVMGRCTIWGTLSAIADDHLRLTETVIQDELEGNGWYEQMQYGQEDGGGPRNTETIVRLDVVLHVTSNDDDLPPPVVPQTETDEEAEQPEDSLAASLVRLQEGLRSKSIASEPITQSSVDRVNVHLGAELLSLADGNGQRDLIERIDQLRQNFADEHGIIIPPIRLQDDLSLPGNSYRILVNGHRVAESELRIDRLLAIAPNDDVETVPGIETVDPAFGLKARWITKDLQAQASKNGETVVEPPAVLVTHLSETFASRMHELINFQDVQNLINGLREHHGLAVNELVPQISLLRLMKLLKSLLQERVSIRNLMPIVESAVTHLEDTTDKDELLQHVRADIGREICSPFLNSAGCLRARMLDSSEEAEIRGLLGDPVLMHQHDLIANLIWVSSSHKPTAILVRCPQIRQPIFQALSRLGQAASVISFNEVPCDLLPQPVVDESPTV